MRAPAQSGRRAPPDHGDSGRLRGQGGDGPADIPAHPESGRLAKVGREAQVKLEIVAGENACYRLLAFISLKMEIHWKKIL
jgi:hypothetical protein